MFSLKHAALALAALTSLSAAALAQTVDGDSLTNEAVLKLVAAGLPDAAIVAKIRSSKTAFDLSTDRLIELKQKGISGDVLAAMLTPSAPAPGSELSADSADIAALHYPGVYLADSTTRWARILPTTSDQAKTGGIFGYALTGGLASASIKAKIPGPTARVRVRNSNPTFVMYFDESLPRSLQGNSVWTTGVGNQTASPSELTLVRLASKAQGREARVGSINIAGSKTGVMDKDRIGFSAESVRPGVYKITVTSALLPGEYGFIQSVTGGGGGGNVGAMTARVFDFGVE